MTKTTTLAKPKLGARPHQKRRWHSLKLERHLKKQSQNRHRPRGEHSLRLKATGG
jgi:hypothetical protein